MTQLTHLPRRPADRRWGRPRRPLDSRVHEELAVIASRRSAENGSIDLA